MRYHLHFVAGHVEVLDEQGNFLFSADSQQEALKELNTEAAA